METFAEVLRRLRTANGLTQGDLGKQANWSQSQVSRSEKGTFVPDSATVDRL
ncbi:MAG: helix-turn-helix transcriptional regulator, partial [Kutzneria sp.]|nr:helix-turn-helix transcriptional regulator [Kutzneria sp.]